MYTYGSLSDDLAYLAFCGADAGTIGKSVLGYNIPYVHLGDYGGKQIIITGGIHARENVTSLLVMRQAFYLFTSPIAFEGGIYFLPMINPDGALLIEKGADIAADRAEFLRKINGGDDFSLWKANASGVDLNNNFDAGFGAGKGQVNHPSSQGYFGSKPLSEPESRALAEFTVSVAPALTLGYHALGREIYWSFGQSGAAAQRDRRLAQLAATKTGYRLVDDERGSTGGYKDWCVSALGITSLTVEIISEEYSHPLSVLPEDDFIRNRDLPVALAEAIADETG